VTYEQVNRCNDFMMSYNISTSFPKEIMLTKQSYLC